MGNIGIDGVLAFVPPFSGMLDLYSQNKHGRILMVLKNTKIYNISWLSLQIFHSNLFGKVLDKCLAGSLADADACRRAGRGRRKIARGRLRCGSKNGEYLSHGYFRWKKMRFIIIFWGGCLKIVYPKRIVANIISFPTLKLEYHQVLDTPIFIPVERCHERHRPSAGLSA